MVDVINTYVKGQGVITLFLLIQELTFIQLQPNERLIYG